MSNTTNFVDFDNLEAEINNASGQMVSVRHKRRGSGQKTTLLPAALDSNGNVIGLTLPDGSSVGLALPYTWATKPAPADYIGSAFISDIGVGGSYWTSNGTVWKPINGSIVLAETAVAGAAHTGTLTDTTLATINLPADILALTGTIVVETKVTANVVSTATVMYAKLDNTVFSGIGIGVVTTAGVGHKFECQNRNSRTSKLGNNGAVHGYSGASGTAWTTLTVDTTGAVDLTITCAHGNVGSTVTLEAYRITLVYP